MLNGADLKQFLERVPEVVMVLVSRVQGSVPREAGTWMLVSEKEVLRSIGGGQLEFKAVELARAMLMLGETKRNIDLPLGPGLGQCCGGRMELTLTRLGPEVRASLLSDVEMALDAQPSVYVFGAGHVGRALAECLALLPFRTVVVDNRADELGLTTAKVERNLTVLPEAEIRAAPAGSAFVVMTHDHATDFMLVAEALARGDAAYVGMIGSASKRVRFRTFLEESRPWLSDRDLVCPIGAQGTRDKRPVAIAIFVAAEIMSVLQPEDPWPPIGVKWERAGSV